MSDLLPSGEQYEITAGDYRAVVVQVGGGLRELSHAGRPLVDGYAADRLADAGRGQVLAPWPNRVRDGRWSWRGKELQLPLNEPSKGNASHGLVRWAGWSLVERAPDRVVLGYRLHPQPGYPFTLDLQATYELNDTQGLSVRIVAVNSGGVDVPVALGTHPYLAPPGGGQLDSCSLVVPARTRVLVDDRSIPVGTEPVDGTAYDLRQPKRIGDLVLDTAYGDLLPDDDGCVRVVLGGEDGAATELWSKAPWLQVFTGDTLPPDRRRRSVAVEPMTAPANAFATGDSLTVLEPGRSLPLDWGIRAL
jgi:aldose 1-epimerase